MHIGPIVKREDINLKKSTSSLHPLAPWSLVSAEPPAQGLLSQDEAEIEFLSMGSLMNGMKIC